MMSDEIIPTQKGKLNQRVCFALFKFWISFKVSRAQISDGLTGDRL